MFWNFHDDCYIGRKYFAYILNSKWQTFDFSITHNLYSAEVRDIFTCISSKFYHDFMRTSFIFGPSVWDTWNNRSSLLATSRSRQKFKHGLMESRLSCENI